MAKLIKQRDKRDLIRNFEEKATARQRGVAAALSDLRPIERRALDRCHNQADCEGRQPACRVCDYASIELIRRTRRAAKKLAPLGPWTMLTVVDPAWHRPAGQLSEVAPKSLLEMVCQRLRRIEVGPSLLGLDLTLNRVQPQSGDPQLIWTPHINLLIPAAQADAVAGLMKRFIVESPSGAPVYFPTHKTAVQDLWVAINYALKLDLGRTRLRSQTEHGPSGFHLGGRHLSLPTIQFKEFLEWRLSFPTEHLIKLLGLRWHDGKIRLSGRPPVSFVIEIESDLAPNSL